MYPAEEVSQSGLKPSTVPGLYTILPQRLVRRELPMQIVLLIVYVPPISDLSVGAVAVEKKCVKRVT